ncbi:MAG: acyl-CoA dehydrogenase [Cyanobacteria bacterium P01_A01_bin.137]
MALLIVGLIVGLFAVLAYINGPMVAWFACGALVLGVLQVPPWFWGVFGLVAVIFNIPFIRQVVITAPLFKVIQTFSLLPAISDAERAAIEAGAGWVDRDLFSGQPNFKRILAEPYPTLSPNERAFVDGPVEQVCRMAPDWEIYQRQDFPPDVWAYLRQERFFGLMIPSEYGGLGFSTTAYSAVIAKLASRSFAYGAALTSSLDLTRLLLRHGTAEQKRRYLPRLATGEAIPCLALMAALTAGSEAGLHASGTVFRSKDGELSLRLNWRQQATLGAIATLIGLAVRLHDPDNLLGKGADAGLTWVLVPADTPGVQLGRRHNPMGIPVHRSPISGRNVVLPASHIIGGVERVGQGWGLVQSLVTSEAISVPATSTGVAKLVSRVASGYGVVQDHGLGDCAEIGALLARIGGLTYLMDAARLYTCGAVDQGEQPAVASAMATYQLTELSRHIVNDGMDILGDVGIYRGPQNLLANTYTATPILVERASRFTRSSIIYGQGTMCCHSYLADEISALEDNNIAAFDHAFWRHVGLIIHNLTRANVLGCTRGYGVNSPVQGEAGRYYQKLAWASATFAALSDLAMLSRPKRPENIGRFADAFSWMYLAIATLRRFEAEGRRQDDLPLLHWAMNHSFSQVQLALEGLLANLEIPLLGGLMRATTLPWFRLTPMGIRPTDAQDHAVAQLLQSPDSRQHLTQGLHVPTDAGQPLGRLERAYQLSIVAMPVLKKIRTALRNGQLKITPPVGRVEAALRAGLITGADSDLATMAERAQLDAMQVDSFTLSEYRRIGKEYSEEETAETD